MEENSSTQPEPRENPNPNLTSSAPQDQQQQQQQDEAASREQQSSSRRTPFTNLSQVDADLVLARAFQEQERAYMMLRMNADGGSDYGTWEGGSYFHDEDDDYEEDDFEDPETDNEDPDNNNTDNNVDGVDRNVNNSEEDHVDAFDAHIHIDDDVEDEDEDEDEEGDENDDLGVEFDPAVFTSDEEYARALQEAEDTARLFALAGIHDLVSEVWVHEDHGNNSQDTWEEVDPDELSYEELLALGEAVGTESRGLSADTIASLPSIKYKTGSGQNGSNDSCVICRLDYEDDETLTLLSCKHSYHPECLNNWLKINKVCPVCSTEVSSCGHN